MSKEPDSLTTALHKLVLRAIEGAGGWLPFDRFMALALYAPGLGYYANPLPKFGLLPESGSDFVTAPELSPLFGRTLAAQVGEALQATGTDEVWEFGAGSGALALQLLDALGPQVRRYTIVDLSGSLRARQQASLAAHAGKLAWVDQLPEAMQGVVVGNEVLDAMPVKLLARHGGAAGGVWHQRGVALQDGALAWADRPTDLRPPIAVPGPHDYLTEIHPQAEAFVATLAERLLASQASGGKGGAAFFIDYGFPEREYYHPQRHMGTVMCHQGHRVDGDPLAELGHKDITAHVNFSGIALAGQDSGLNVLGYTSQARFLLNCGLVAGMDEASTAQRANALKLVNEHEMGELFKVIGFCTGQPWDAQGFAAGDRSHRL
ncbi:SAM-dependent methyltransferase [Ramlibacter sp. 2FC]|uniref:class I SAM-dependent methyltransferase n=1 Tax=Ramlibacter sp. 2FC TaxID=2502188 RepID=UPI0014859202|nr:SAM-dependent methyltransferase [Ramlibacter sp. 2FC]